MIVLYSSHTSSSRCTRRNVLYYRSGRFCLSRASFLLFWFECRFMARNGSSALNGNFSPFTWLYTQRPTDRPTIRPTNYGIHAVRIQLLSNSWNRFAKTSSKLSKQIATPKYLHNSKRIAKIFAIIKIACYYSRCSVFLCKHLKQTIKASLRNSQNEWKF